MKPLHFENRQKNIEHLLLALAKIAIFPARAFAARDHMCCLSCAPRLATSFLKSIYFLNFRVAILAQCPRVRTV